jgi:hypothetical protein
MIDNNYSQSVDYTDNTLIISYIASIHSKRMITKVIRKEFIPFSSVSSLESFDRDGFGGIVLNNGTKHTIDKKPWRAIARFKNIF